MFVQKFVRIRAFPSIPRYSCNLITKKSYHLNYIFVLLYVIQIINENYIEILLEISSSRYIHGFMNRFKDEWKLFEYKLDVFFLFC